MVLLDFPIEAIIIGSIALGGYAVEQRLALCHLRKDVRHLMTHLGCSNHKKEAT